MVDQQRHPRVARDVGEPGQPDVALGLDLVDSEAQQVVDQRERHRDEPRGPVAAQRRQPADRGRGHALAQLLRVVERRHRASVAPVRGSCRDGAAAAGYGRAVFGPEFEQFDVVVGGVRIHGVRGGSGPPVLLLLHGFPQSHVMWHRIAAELAREHTVVAADLRGYGDSDRPEPGPGHAGYAFRAMAGTRSR